MSTTIIKDDQRCRQLIEIKGRLIDDLHARYKELEQHIAIGTLPSCVHPDYEVIRAPDTCCASPRSPAELRFRHWCQRAALPALQFEHPGTPESGFDNPHSSPVLALARLRCTMQIIRQIDSVKSEAAAKWAFAAVHQLHHSMFWRRDMTSADLVMDELGFWPYGLVFGDDFDRHNCLYVAFERLYYTPTREARDKAIKVWETPLLAARQWGFLSIFVCAKRVESKSVVRADMLVAPLHQQGVKTTLAGLICDMAGMKRDWLETCHGKPDNSTKMLDLAFVQAEGARRPPPPPPPPVVVMEVQEQGPRGTKRKREVVPLDQEMTVVVPDS
jgi:hypothetical protein